MLPEDEREEELNEHAQWDAEDIAIHTMAASLVGVLAALVPEQLSVIILVGNAAFWLFRELYQSVNGAFRQQGLLEWVPAVLAAPAWYALVEWA